MGEWLGGVFKRSRSRRIYDRSRRIYERSRRMYYRRRRMYDRRRRKRSRRMYERSRRMYKRSRRMYDRSEGKLCVVRLVMLVRLAVLGWFWPVYSLVGWWRVEESGWVGRLGDWGVVGWIW